MIDQKLVHPSQATARMQQGNCSENNPDRSVGDWTVARDGPLNPPDNLTLLHPDQDHVPLVAEAQRALVGGTRKSACSRLEEK